MHEIFTDMRQLALVEGLIFLQFNTRAYLGQNVLVIEQSMRLEVFQHAEKSTTGKLASDIRVQWREEKRDRCRYVFDLEREGEVARAEQEAPLHGQVPHMHANAIKRAIKLFEEWFDNGVAYSKKAELKREFAEAIAKDKAAA